MLENVKIGQNNPKLNKNIQIVQSEINSKVQKRDEQLITRT